MIKNKDKKVIYYSDPLTDDFANNPTKPFKVSDEFKYVHTNWLYRLVASFIYHVIAVPLFYLIVKIKYHVKVINKSAVKKLKHTGFFIYGNHSQDIIDALLNQVMLVPTRRGHIVASNDVYSLKGLNTLVSMLGCLPTPNNLFQTKKFFDANKYYIEKNRFVIVLPEAHVWPYYNDIRPFTNTGFMLPAMLHKPIITSTVVYRARKNPRKHPYITLVVSNPIYPKDNVEVKENQNYLRDEAYRLMKQAVTEYHSYQFIQYVQKTDTEKIKSL
ncbi:MAG: hypothetical protein MJ207_02850 [Bacilli bacterium]|nr:hypothetical protein [Bacilli bacterium]